MTNNYCRAIKWTKKWEQRIWALYSHLNELFLKVLFSFLFLPINFSNCNVMKIYKMKINSTVLNKFTIMWIVKCESNSLTNLVNFG